MPSDVNLGVRSPKGLLPLCGSKLQLRFQVARDYVIILKFDSPFHIITGHKLVVTSFADGSGGPLALRTSPLASELPLTCEALPFAGAALPLTCPPAAANSSTFAALTTPEGLRSLRSASSLSFLVTCQRQVIPSHSFAALAALIVRRVNGFANQPMPVCISRRATPKGVERVPGSGTLPPFAALTALVVRREVGWKPTFALHVPAAARPRRA